MYVWKNGVLSNEIVKALLQWCVVGWGLGIMLIEKAVGTQIRLKTILEISCLKADMLRWVGGMSVSIATSSRTERRLPA